MTAEIAPRHTEASMTALLDRRYGAVSMGARRYATVAQVRNRPGSARRICDYIALDTYQVADGDWRGPRFAVHGHEIKVSRADWLNELKDPTKAVEFSRHCTHWWLVVSDAKIVRDDLPEGWGLLVAHGQSAGAQGRPGCHRGRADAAPAGRQHDAHRGCAGAALAV